MITQCRGDFAQFLFDRIHIGSRLIRILAFALLLSLAMLAFAFTPTFAQSPPSPNILVDDYVSVPKNGSVEVEVLGNDTLPEFRSFDFTGPENGRITTFSSNAFRKTLAFTYRPKADYVGQDSFSYRISDNSGRTLHATVFISVFAALDCSTCLISHAGTPVNITIGGDGAFNFKFIGDDGVASGPVLPPVRELAEEHQSESGNIVLYEGLNTISGAPVVVSYLAADQVLHVNTSYLDRHNGTMKPYIFVIDVDDEVSHWEW